MNSQERLLISQLFDRLRGASGAPRDPEAEALIRSEIAAQPYAPYAMAQTIVVQNQAIEAAQQKIQALEAQLRGDAGYDRPRSALGGMRSGDRPMGAPDLGGGPQQQPAGPWAHQRAQAQPAAPQGGGFLAGAAQTALGVAGGVMLGSMIGGMFGSSSAKAEPAAADDAKDEPAADNAADDGGDEGDSGGFFSDMFGGDGDGGGDW